MLVFIYCISNLVLLGGKQMKTLTQVYYSFTAIVVSIALLGFGTPVAYGSETYHSEVDGVMIPTISVTEVSVESPDQAKNRQDSLYETGPLSSVESSHSQSTPTRTNPDFEYVTETVQAGGSPPVEQVNYVVSNKRTGEVVGRVVKGVNGTNAMVGSVLPPDVSADGKYLIHLNQISYSNGNSTYRLYVIDIENGQQRFVNVDDEREIVDVVFENNRTAKLIAEDNSELFINLETLEETSGRVYTKSNANFYYVEEPYSEGSPPTTGVRYRVFDDLTNEDVGVGLPLIKGASGPQANVGSVIAPDVSESATYLIHVNVISFANGESSYRFYVKNLETQEVRQVSLDIELMIANVVFHDNRTAKIISEDKSEYLLDLVNLELTPLKVYTESNSLFYYTEENYSEGSPPTTGVRYRVFNDRTGEEVSAGIPLIKSASSFRLNVVGRIVPDVSPYALSGVSHLIFVDTVSDANRNRTTFRTKNLSTDEVRFLSLTSILEDKNDAIENVSFDNAHTVRIVTEQGVEYLIDLNQNPLRVMPSSVQDAKSIYQLRYARNTSEDWGGLGEKWMKGLEDEWFYILPDGRLYQWTSGTREGMVNQDQLVAMLNPADHQNLSWLASHSTASLLAEHGFKPASNESYNWGGHQEKWFKNAANDWVYILPDGRIYRWDSGTKAGMIDGDTLLAHVDPQHHADLRWLSPGVIKNPTALKSNLGFVSTGNDHRNYGGKNEKWFKGANGSWYYILPNGWVYQWTSNTKKGVGSAQDTLIGILEPNPYVDFLAWLS